MLSNGFRPIFWSDQTDALSKPRTHALAFAAALALATLVPQAPPISFPSAAANYAVLIEPGAANVSLNNLTSTLERSASPGS